ncbi:alpha-amylase family glycosyl hydrolase [Hahella sp. SMD15-11]|uniref:Alpha-amylase family glycosyl hydrolase n=1 Tax=Thermohahella caldifontis TaxID=3142973 RepID=A0AB39UUD4_9GAMM
MEETSDAVTYVNAEGQTVHPLGYMVGEIWKGAGDIASQGYGTEAQPGLCSAFNFPLRYNLVQTLAVEESGAGGKDATNLNAGMDWNLAYPSHAVPNNFLGNHDLVRFGDLLQRGNVAQPSDDAWWQRHALAWAFLTSRSGPLTLYYGEEIGDELPGFDQKVDCANDGGAGARAGLCDDHVSRTSGKVNGVSGQVGEAAFTLSAAQQALHDEIRTLMQLRDQHPALYAGSRTPIAVPASLQATLYVDHKATDSEAVLVMINTGETDGNLTLAAADIGSEGTLTDLISAETFSAASGHYTLTVPALGYRFLKIDAPSAGGPASSTGSLTGTGDLARCDLPDVSGDGPIGVPVYIRGNYSGGNNFSATPADRQFHYKGDNLYQVVVDEPSATAYGFKFATADWSREYAVEGSAPVRLGETQNLAVASGPGTESSLTLPQAGRYVFSFRINADLQTGEMMVSLCP